MRIGLRKCLLLSRKARFGLAIVASPAGTTFGCGAFAEEKFQRLGGAQIRTKFVGMELSLGRYIRA